MGTCAALWRDRGQTAAPAPREFHYLPVARMQHSEIRGRCRLPVPIPHAGRTLTLSVIDACQIQRTGRANTGLTENMGINHGGRYVCMPRQFLHGTNIVIRFQQMRCETVAQGMTSHPLVDVAGCSRALDHLLQRAFVQMMTTDRTPAGIRGEAAGREQELPLQFATRIRVFARQRIGQVYLPVACSQVPGMQFTDRSDLPAQVINQGAG